MHWSDWNFHSMAIRHLLAVYAIVLITQGAYFAWMVSRWRALNSNKKSARPE